MSASQRKPWKRFVKRATVQGGEGGDRQSRSRSDNVAALLGRLRRLELAVLDLAGVTKLTPEALDSMLQAMLDLSRIDAPTPSSGSEDPGDPVPIPHEGSVDG